MNLFKSILEDVASFVLEQTGSKIALEEFVVNETRKEFEGDYTLLIFPLVRSFKKSPEATGHLIGEQLKTVNKYVISFNVIKGFLNLEMSPSYWIEGLNAIHQIRDFGKSERKGEKVMVEYSSPNTNKPLHLGHIRNILLGWSVSRILDAAGYDVVKTQVVNDRGIAVCKSMLAWEKFSAGETPESSGMKGDHLVGKYYVEFDKHFKEEYASWQKSDEGKKKFENSGMDDREKFFSSFKNDYFNAYSKIGKEARDMLLKWEAKDPDTIALWEKMNNWVYAGFDQTYDLLGVNFDANYYESSTFSHGREIVEKGLAKELFYRAEDGSIWVDLEDVKMDKKILLRSDGTALYITQDLGTAELRYQDHKAKKMVYVVGDEQDYHFKVLFELVKRLGRPYAEGLYHLSYGMVDLPTGRMKSREGTVVDADDLVAEVISVARESALSRAADQGAEMVVNEEDLKKIALAALKFFIIKVHPQKRMVFNPEESLDMQGQTGPYIQNAFVRIQSIFRKFGDNLDLEVPAEEVEVNSFEKELLASIFEFPAIVEQAAKDYQPSTIANYCYDLAKKMHKFYAEVRILSIEDEALKQFRLKLIHKVAQVLKDGMELLGVEMVQKM